MIKTLETERLILRAPKDSDIPIWQKNINNWEIIRHLTTAVPWPYPDNGVHIYWNDVVKPALGKTEWAWVITHKDAPDQMIGNIHFTKKDETSFPTTGFWLIPEYWGQGLMPEATTAIYAHAFNEIGFEGLCIANAATNPKSRRVQEKMGATLIETLLTDRIHDPAHTHEEVWHLTKEAWAARNR